jgi:hypothetical protein
MNISQRFLRFTRRDATLLVWANTARYGFSLKPTIARDQDEHSTIIDARWLCFGLNVAFVDEAQVSRGPQFADGR